METTKRRLLLVSNSTLHGSGYLDHCHDHIAHFFGKLERVLFVPYALHDRDAYAKTARTKFNRGGNTFRLLKCLYDNQLVADIRRRVLEEGVPYMGSRGRSLHGVQCWDVCGAGTNVSTVSISTTNDMPIVCPPSFSAIGLVPFNINPHYLDHDPGSRHMGRAEDSAVP
ncbi:hypothetical protein NHX12_007595 [Muraenolepis orangiensis]|uniref:Alpha-aspartyl dipeptidase n=1 Tax=Muraenolepis orangiensis TaxID=630683 RepID=A0A9Q0IC52_9TELE|nr:hypothetical protein NHX12_007595 [Muraenolepis orangiensis]